MQKHNIYNMQTLLTETSTVKMDMERLLTYDPDLWQFVNQENL